MSPGNPFFDRPILNSPYGCSERHWELDNQGQPTQNIIGHRRPAEFITPIPKPKKRKGTRARDHLLVTSVETASEFLDDLQASACSQDRPKYSQGA